MKDAIESWKNDSVNIAMEKARKDPCTGPCCMDHPEGCLIMVFFNTGDNLDAT